MFGDIRDSYDGYGRDYLRNILITICCISVPFAIWKIIDIIIWINLHLKIGIE